ncbi:glycosyltransferase family 4 protein [Candidatus Woesearchaeota archaeon]|jgi:glycosyltransferase involved in cell wall biosynthesis|nr:glycosyltransferase family 4 protein [Candidatus Woesearchaeota archaeon]MBT5397211.1 glycosyltransferase family 4 protein [Candidatus Woesearchaeota archaeon]MBT6367243.1 glycosyltransferase family 4 protein [Candidatus Woesearchaeota archaeon]MBT7762611.1 glycosyltransferase family 4 protein [Candidatus Woesearchaeota archaeon]
MKVAIIATFLGQKTSGAEISSFLLATSFNTSKENDSAFVITTKVTHKMPFRCYSVPSLKRVPNSVLLIGHRIIDTQMEKRIYSIFVKEKPDIVHIQDSSMMIAAIRAARRLRIPTVFTVRDYRFSCNLSIPLEQGIIPFHYSKKTYKKWLYQSFVQGYNKGWISTYTLPWFYTQNNRLLQYFKNIDYYVTVSDFVKNKVIESGIEEDKVKTIKVQKEEWEPISLKQAPKTIQIFTAGGLKKTKGFDYLIRSFRHVVDIYPHAQLRIAGDGSSREALGKLTQQLHLKHNVTFLGNINHDTMKNEYAQSSFVISPSLWPEPLTRIIFESFTMKKTIVATNVGGSAELVINGKTGLTVEARDINGMANAIIKLIKEPNTRNKLASSGHTLITKVSNASAVFQHHRNVYEKLVNIEKR